MDTFFNDVNVVLFKEWILTQHNSHYHINLSPDNDNHIIMTTDQCHGDIIFHPNNIIELSITHTLTQDIIFYLHFQMTTMKHAIDLFNEMIDTLLNFKNNNTKKVIICCSGGLTSSYFTSKIKEALKLISSDYIFEACAYTKLSENAFNADIILLAPQISYLCDKTKDNFPNKTVLNIPPHIFAKYDVGKLLTFLNKEYMSQKDNQSLFNNPYDYKYKMTTSRPILCISIYQRNQNLYMSKTIYIDNNNIINDISMKSNFSLSDIINVIDTSLLSHNEIEHICISLPCTIVNNVIINTQLKQLENMNLLDYLESKYSKIQFHIDSDVYTKAIGYHYIHKDKSLVYIDENNNNIQFAFLYNGIPIKNNNIKSNLKYLPIINDTHKNHFYFQDTLLIKTLVSIICILTPDIIVLGEDQYYSSISIQEELAHYLPQDHIPKIIKSDNDSEYLYIGQIIHANYKK